VVSLGDAARFVVGPLAQEGTPMVCVGHVLVMGGPSGCATRRHRIHPPRPKAPARPIQLTFRQY